MNNDRHFIVRPAKGPASGFSVEIERTLEVASRGSATLLINGPTGSGKTRLARLVHEASDRRAKPFVSVNLATVHEGTLESELFGHERGAFTGADQRRIGRLEAANGGTVFLDEIGELSPRMQARLLEFLQSRTVVPVGGNREIKLDVRIIAATHRDLDAWVEAGRFREDLYHRLRVFVVELPALRRRADQFDAIVHELIDELCVSARRSVLRISEEVAKKLESHAWPGNLRELRNVLEYAVHASGGPEILESDLPPWFRRPLPEKAEKSNAVLGVAEIPMTLDYQACVDGFERDYLVRALERFGWRINMTARQIGMNKTTLIRRVRDHRIQMPAWTVT